MGSEGKESGSCRSASSWRPLGTGEEVVWDAKRDGRRVVLSGGLPERGDLEGPLCRIFHPPETEYSISDSIVYSILVRHTLYNIHRIIVYSEQDGIVNSIVNKRD